MSALTPDTDSHDPYAMLGVAPDTPFHEVKLVYRRLVRELHPDANRDDPNARARFDAVQMAFEMLRSQQAQIPRAPRAASQEELLLRTTGHRPDPEPPPAVQPEPAIEKHAGFSTVDTHSTAATPAPGQSGILRTPLSAAPPPTAPLVITGGLSSPGSGKLLNRLLQDAPAAPQRTRTERLADDISGGVAQPLGSGPLPDGSGLLQISTVPGREKLLLQSRAQMFYLLLELKLGDRVRTTRQPINLSLVLDHSSSMQRNDKLQRLKEAVSRIIDIMEPTDILSIITFGDRATVLLPSGEIGNKRAAKEALDSIRCRGGTEISNGIRVGLQELERNPHSYLSQMILLTDGQTYGDEAICLHLASEAGERQTQITALGLGDDWNTTLLDEVAARTGGIADYVQNAEQLAAVFEDQLRVLQNTALRNMKMSIRAAANCGLIRATWVAPAIQQITLPQDIPTGQPYDLDLGRMSSDRDYRLLVELVVAARGPGTADIADVAISYDAPGLQVTGQSAQCHVTAHFVTEWEKEPTVDLRVHDALRKITAHRLQEQALQAIQDGQTLKGTANLRTAAKHLEDAGCQDLAGMARAEADRVERKGQVQAGAMKRIIYGTRKLG